MRHISHWGSTAAGQLSWADHSEEWGHNNNKEHFKTMCLLPVPNWGAEHWMSKDGLRWSECTYKQLNKIQVEISTTDPQCWYRIFPHCSPKKQKYSSTFQIPHSLKRTRNGFQKDYLHIYIGEPRIQSMGATSSWCPFIQSSSSIRSRPRPVSTTIRTTGIQR